MTTPISKKAYQRYTKLLKSSLSNELNPENGLRISYLLKCMDTSTPYNLDHLIHIGLAENQSIQDLANDPNGQDNYRERIFGFPFSMIGKARLDSLQDCVETVLSEQIPGDFLEAGVWRGGASILMKAILDAWEEPHRQVWVADSFAGLPKPSLPQDEGQDFYKDKNLAVPLKTVQEHFRRFDLLDERVHFLKGWFCDTLPSAPIDQLAILRADGDMYESTLDILNNLYDKVSPGGFVIIDDYGAIDVCKQAVDEFRDEHRIDAPITRIDWTGAFWRKPKP